MKFFYGLLFFLAFSFTGPMAGETFSAERVKVGYIPLSENLPFFVALEKGFFEKDGVTVEPVRFRNGSLAVKALMSGKVDMVAGTGFFMFFKPEIMQPGRIKLLIPFAEVRSKVMSYLLAGNKSNINSLSDLKGKKVGTYIGTSQVMYLKLILKSIGYNPDKDLKILQIPSGMQIQALNFGQFDALFTVDPYGTMAMEQGVGNLLIDNPRNKYISAPFWVGSAAIDSTFYKKNTDKVKKIYRVFEKAIDFIDSNEKEAKKMSVKYTPLDSDLAVKSGVYKWFKVDGEIDYFLIQKVADLFYDNGLLGSRVNVSSLFLTPEELK